MASMSYLLLLFVCCVIGGEAAALDPNARPPSSRNDVGAATSEKSPQHHFVVCYHMEKTFRGSCPAYRRSGAPFYKAHLNDRQETINSSKVFGRFYPKMVKCVWTFRIRPGERATIVCPYIDLDTSPGDCNTGVCSRSVVEQKKRDYLQIVGEVRRKKSWCEKSNRLSRCKECEEEESGPCKNGSGKESYVAFCGKWPPNHKSAKKAAMMKVTKPRADIRYEETKGGKIKVVFWSDETSQGKGFLCKYTNLNRNPNGVE